MRSEFLADSFQARCAVAELKLPQFEIERVEVRGCKKFVLNFRAPPLGADFLNKSLRISGEDVVLDRNLQGCV